MASTFRQQHLAMLLTYSGISFLSGAVNHGFFSGERSLWTAAAGIVLFVAGAWLEHRGKEVTRRELARTLAWGSVLSIGLGFFTGGLQHFPDSPARSAWVVPLGFAVSAIALLSRTAAGVRQAGRGAVGYVLLAGTVVAMASTGAWQWLGDAPHPLEAHHHDEGPAAPAPAALQAQVVTRTVEVKMLDAMRFEPSAVEVQAGETVRIVARNTGQAAHELVLGAAADIRAHAEAMRQDAGHAHGGGAAAVQVAPGQSADLVVTFREPMVLTMACLLPGHFEAGMAGSWKVAASGATAPAPHAQAQKADTAHGPVGHKH